MADWAPQLGGDQVLAQKWRETRAWRMAFRFLLACAVSLLCVGAAFFYRWWYVDPPATLPSLPPAAALDPDGRIAVRSPGAVYVATVATFRDELFAYLMYQHYRLTAPFQSDELLLCQWGTDSETRYRVLLILPNDAISTVDRVAELHARTQVEEFAWRRVPDVTLTHYRQQTRLFVSAYNLPVQRKMEELSKEEIHRLVQRFIRFKSTTDPRVRKGIEPLPQVLQTGDAHRLAGDIIAVAEFYDLPLEFLLGIGAMENNYMNVRGDLKNSAWKRKPAKDDIVLERRKGRYRVLNDSAGVWQITRETLRYAHRLYLRDKRDYSALPEHLQPDKQLDVNTVAPEVLTTYAGLLLRDLLDRFDGDVGLAVGAYNGGPGNPNLRYYEGVQNVADHARKILEHAAVLNGESVLSIPWWTSQ